MLVRLNCFGEVDSDYFCCVAIDYIFNLWVSTSKNNVHFGVQRHVRFLIVALEKSNVVCLCWFVSAIQNMQMMLISA